MGEKKEHPNKTTKRVRNWIFELVQDNIETLENDLKDLEPKERWSIIEKLLPYIVSKRQEASNRSYTFDFSDEELKKMDIV